jgi:hypothetical protein
MLKLTRRNALAGTIKPNPRHGAADIYAEHPGALQLRAMNIIYETPKERGATILMPSSMVDSVNPSAATVALAVASTGVLDPELTQRPVAGLIAPGQ